MAKICDNPQMVLVQMSCNKQVVNESTSVPGNYLAITRNEPVIPITTRMTLAGIMLSKKSQSPKVTLV